ncbi:MAG: hypothetical protein CMF62_01430 [Magnetococcales bacterium]|nr:hypothetical protein [Magnetococcales bacterium]|tara:strand:+ start:12061 stop:13275 length:1215 start_codon:yes stop_codon:yes gene_type:complete
MLFSTDSINNDIITGILIIIVSALATIGGVGGGGILIPLYILLTGLPLDNAIPLAIISILGNTIIRVLYFFNKKRPMSLNKRFLINMSPILLIVPFDSATSFFGVLLSRWTPTIITLIVIIIVLTLTFYNVSKKAYKLYQYENSLTDSHLNSECIMIDGIDIELNTNDLEQARRNRINERKTGDEYVLNIMFMLMAFFTMVIFGIFSFTRNLLEPCSSYYWIQISMQILIALLIGRFMIFIVRRDNEEKIIRNYFFMDGDIQWNFQNISSLILGSSVTGFLSTYMGIGGGMIMNPILISILKMSPQVVVATSSVSTFFSSLISTINYVTSDQILWDYAIYFFIASLIGSFIGIKISSYLISILQRQSVMAFVLAIIILISTILLLINTLLNNSLNNFEFGDICT